MVNGVVVSAPSAGNGTARPRASARGDKEKPLRIHYPRGDSMIELLRQYVSRIADNVKYELEWQPVEPGQELSLGPEKERGLVCPFVVHHSMRTVNLGYRLFERRTRLRPELAGFAEADIARIAKEKGREAVTEEYAQTLLAYCGDSSPVDPNEVRGAEVLMHEGTFIDAADRAHEAHSTVAEALDYFRPPGPRDE